MFGLCSLFDPTLDFLDVNMIVVFHLTHSPMLLHIQMIVGNFPQSLQHIDISVFFHLPVFH
jgi:hypothetical protein